MAKPGKLKMHTVSITIQWREADTEIAYSNPGSSNPNATSLGQRLKEGAAYDNEQCGMQNEGARPTYKRLLPSDRIVLNALRSRLSRGEQVTTLVRTRELMVECDISRRQVQICLKRLSERGLIKRLVDAENVGSNVGYRYQI